MTTREMAEAAPVVEILYFEGCPNHEGARALVEEVGAELGIDPVIRFVDVPDAVAAERERFLGSPTIRIGGRDIEPGAEQRTDYGFTCRVFRTSTGLGPTPDRAWVAAALSQAVGRAQPAHASAAATLRAARIPHERCGAARTARLTGPERSLYVSVLRAFATGERPGRATLLDLAEGADLDSEAVIAKLEAEDLVHVDADGAIGVAYPFSGHDSAHRVQINGDVVVRAMCAIDALGIAYMVDQPVSIDSLDPISGERVHVQLAPGEVPSWEPAGAVVLAGSPACEGPSYCGCCDVLNFFATAENAETYLDTHPDVDGFAISIVDAADAGRAVFEQAMRPG